MPADSESSIAPETPELVERPPGRRKRRWQFRMAAVILGALLAETVSFLTLAILEGTDAIVEQRWLQGKIAQGTPSKGETNETIHPYTGWSFNPQVGSQQVIEGREVPVNRLGLLDDGLSIVSRTKGRVAIAIVGGSVAWQVSVLGEERLRKVLLADPIFYGKEIDIVRLALPGQKQPQQLMTMAWVQSLGAEFDVVVNVDGYNEAVLAIHDNHKNGVNMAYPRAWHARTLDIVEAREFSDSYELLRIRGTRQRLAREALGSSIWWSPTYQLVWRLRHNSLEADRARLRVKLMHGHYEVNGRGYVAAGPIEKFANDTEADAAAVELWLRCSVQLHRLVTGDGAVYVHALQPNQYLPGSKPLSKLEAKNFHSTTAPEGKTISRLYPRMIATGARLREKGVCFYDLTSIFEDVPETLYVDWCCHYNAVGNEMLAEHVAASILDAMADRLTGSPVD